MATPDYKVNYDDKRLTDVKAEEKTALSDLEKTYTDMVGNTDKYYDDLVQNSEDWMNKQTEIQNQQTAFTIEKVEQQREQAHKDYLKEQSGAYGDWIRQSNQYGVEAEKMAAQGLQNTGYSESSQVSMYNAYQNRVATAREAFSKATLNYDNAIKEAQLQNSAALAELAYQTYQQQLELSLQSFQYKNSLISELTDKKMQTKQMYQNQWQSVLNQINTENALAEEVRQFNKNYEEQVRQFNEELARLKAKDAADASQAAAELALKKKQLEEEKRQFDAQMAQKQTQITKTGSSDKTGLYGGTSALLNRNNNNKSSDIVVVDSPLNAKGAADKVASGELIVTKQEGNRVWVAANPNYVKGQASLDAYTKLARPWAK